MCAVTPRRGYFVRGTRKPTQIPAAIMDDPERRSVNGRDWEVAMVWRELEITGLLSLENVDRVVLGFRDCQVRLVRRQWKENHIENERAAMMEDYVLSADLKATCCFI
jgi:hypothetical protein